MRADSVPRPHKRPRFSDGSRVGNATAAPRPGEPFPARGSARADPGAEAEPVPSPGCVSDTEPMPLAKPQ